MVVENSEGRCVTHSRGEVNVNVLRIRVASR